MTPLHTYGQWRFSKRVELVYEKNGTYEYKSAVVVPSKTQHNMWYHRWCHHVKRVSRMWGAQRSSAEMEDAVVSRVVRFRSYLHGKITATSFMRRQGFQTTAGTSKPSLYKGVQQGSLVICRKVRRSCTVAGTRRYLPVRKSFTRHGRDIVRDGAHLVETACPGLGIFLTLTIPNANEDALFALSCASAYICDRLLRWLRGRIVGGHFVYVWELQRRGSPHMHMLFRVPRNIDLGTFVKRVRQEWRQILMDVSD